MPSERSSPSGGWREVYDEMESDTGIEEPQRCRVCGRPSSLRLDGPYCRRHHPDDDGDDGDGGGSGGDEADDGRARGTATRRTSSGSGERPGSDGTVEARSATRLAD